MNVQREEIVKKFIEIKIESPDDFLKIRETLTRIGIANRNKDTLWQSCHILHKQGKYYICHFKELFMLDGREVDFSIDDEERRNTIADVLVRWEMCKYAGKKPATTNAQNITIIPHAEKSKWKLETKYKIGKKFDRKD